ncbi:MAG: hypothetical protein ACUVXG_00410 [Anaerolineae bacterium]
MDRDDPVYGFLQIALALNVAVGRRTGIEPVLSAATYDYGIPTPAWHWEEIGRKIEEVESGLSALPPARAGYLRDLLQACSLMVREGQGEDIPYAVRVATYLQVPGERVPTETVRALEAELRSLLVEAGYPDDLSVAVPQWRGQQTLASEALAREGQAILRRAQPDRRRLADSPYAHAPRQPGPEGPAIGGHLPGPVWGPVGGLADRT